MMRTILVVEDDPAVAEGIRLTLESEDFGVATVSGASGALEWLDGNIPDLILADITMPDINGYQFFQRVRVNPNWLWIPFIFLTARGEIEDIRYGKELGVDDYLIKPVEPEDLLVAVRGRLTRFEKLKTVRQPASIDKPTGNYQIGKLLVRFSYRQVTVDRRDANLSSTEFDVLQRLIIARGAVVSYAELLGYDESTTMADEKDAAQLLRYHVRSIRQKIRATGETSEIVVNVRGVGYRLVEEVSDGLQH